MVYFSAGQKVHVPPPSRGAEVRQGLLDGSFRPFWRRSGCPMDERNKRLQEAARENDWHRVKKLLETGADPDAEGPFGPLLLTALLLGHMTVARLLVEAGADVNIWDDNGWTPLHWAAKAGDMELIVAVAEADGDLLA